MENRKMTTQGVAGMIESKQKPFNPFISMGKQLLSCHPNLQHSSSLAYLPIPVLLHLLPCLPPSSCQSPMPFSCITSFGFGSWLPCSAPRIWGPRCQKGRTLSFNGYLRTTLFGEKKVENQWL